MLTSILSFPQGTPKSELAVARWRVHFIRRGLHALTEPGSPGDPDKRTDYQCRLATAEAELDRLEYSRSAMAAKVTARRAAMAGSPGADRHPVPA